MIPMHSHGTMSGSRPRSTWALLVCAAVIGCGSASNPGLTATTESTGLTGSTIATTDASSSSSASSSTSATSEAPTTTAEPCPTFICQDQDLVIGDCDVFAQDCPEGEKCAAVITDGGGAWNYSRCVPVIGSDVAGDPCTIKSVAEGLDSCAKGAMCWDLEQDGDGGTCIALCMGTAEAATCTNGSQCTIANMGVLNLCFSQCDPLVQDCPGWSQSCQPVGEGFLCGPNPQGPDIDGDANAVCEFQAACDPGLECGDPAFVGAGCPEGSQGCCTPFCEFPDGACPNPDQQCVQWFDPMMLPPDDPKLLIGACGLPQ